MGGMSTRAHLSLVTAGFATLIGVLLLIHLVRNGVAPPPAPKAPPAVAVKAPPRLPAPGEAFELPAVSDAQADAIRMKLGEIENGPSIHRRQTLPLEQRRARTFVRAFREALAEPWSPERDQALRRRFETTIQRDPLFGDCILLALHEQQTGVVGPDDRVEPKRRRPLPAEELEELVLGKKKEEVRKLLGGPGRIERDRDGANERWLYWDLTPNSELTVLQFRRDGDQVTVDFVVYQLSTNLGLAPLPAPRGR
jgi:hypothetical protein